MKLEKKGALINKLQKTALIILYLIIVISIKLYSEKEVFKIPPIDVEGELPRFWFWDKEYKYFVKYDYFFFGIYNCRLIDIVKYENEYCYILNHSFNYHLERFGIEDKYKKSGIFIFTYKGIPIHYNFRSSIMNEKKIINYEFEKEVKGDNINVNKKSKLPLSDKKVFIIDKMELAHWFVFFYYFYNKNSPFKPWQKWIYYEKIFLIDDTLDFNYKTDFRNNIKTDYKEITLTIIVGLPKLIKYKSGYLRVNTFYIKELDLNISINQFGELMEFKDNNGFEAKLE